MDRCVFLYKCHHKCNLPLLPLEQKTDLSDCLVFLIPPTAVAQQDTLAAEISPWDLVSNISTDITFPRGSYKMCLALLLLLLLLFQ